MKYFIFILTLGLLQSTSCSQKSALPSLSLEQIETLLENDNDLNEDDKKTILELQLRILAEVLFENDIHNMAQIRHIDEMRKHSSRPQFFFIQPLKPVTTIPQMDPESIKSISSQFKKRNCKKNNGK